MNEDDTFNRLRRRPYDELYKLYTEIYMTRAHTEQEIDAWLRIFGWTLEEARAEYDRRKIK